jgi:guanylate kinase
MKETLIQSHILLHFGSMPIMRIWRVNVGMAYSFFEVRKLISIICGGHIIEAIKFSKGMQPIRFGTKGHSDIMGILQDGRGLFIEIKALHGKQSPEQCAFQKMVESLNGIYIVAREIKDVESRLKLEGYKL